MFKIIPASQLEWNRIFKMKFIKHFEPIIFKIYFWGGILVKKGVIFKISKLCLMHSYVLHFESKHMFGVNLAEVKLVVRTQELNIFKILYLFTSFLENGSNNKNRREPQNLLLNKCYQNRWFWFCEKPLPICRFLFC